MGTRDIFKIKISRVLKFWLFGDFFVACFYMNSITTIHFLFSALKAVLLGTEPF